ncbi:hypothetical protein GPECTOR_5g165 [Gonium pectorale]|uniref:Protein kinase domain-containing protein n=1 Tax=Gonium pectorale TaxID=33097 RepID=A0A150GVZ0_GONPE|nr:hypothetical protein GPECTOR_5g165 [Gonium pectorale]|eukprot:KXZ54057.1 hypothetical protein GPECTOR_5g165 [Gonium pectorale]
MPVTITTPVAAALGASAPAPPAAAQQQSTSAAPAPASGPLPGVSSTTAAAGAPHPSDDSFVGSKAPGLPAVPSTERMSVVSDMMRSTSATDVPALPMAALASEAPSSSACNVAEGNTMPDKARRVRVETTRRSTAATGGQHGGAETSASASASQSEASSQQQGSSAQHAASPHGTGPTTGSSAAQGASVAGESAAAASTAGTDAVGVGSVAGSSAPTVDASQTSSTPATTRENNAGFMFGAPRMKDHGKEKRRKAADKRPKSHSSSSNTSGAGLQPGGDGTPSGSKRSGGEGSSDPSRTAGSSGVAVPGIGSSAAGVSISSSGAPCSSMPLRPGSTAGTTGTTGDASLGGGPAGRRIRVKGSTEGSSGRGSIRTAGASSAMAGIGEATAVGVSELVAEGVPPPVPEGEAEGEASDRSGSSPRSSSEHLSIMSPPEGSDVENVLQLICNIFQIPVALVAAYRSSNIFIRSTAIKLTDDEQWRYSLAQWSMMNVHDLKDVLMVPDATLDERFKEYYCVKNTPRVRFFMASPLRASTGELLGTLCMADFTEKAMEPANLLVVNNLQTLVIRQLERDMSLAQERMENEAATEKLQQEMMRALDHFEKCIMFVDTSKPGWEVLYTNMAWEHITGIPREHVFGGMPGTATAGVPRVHVLGRSLQDFFMALGGAGLDWSSTAAEVASRAEFTVHRVAVRQKPDKLVSLHLRLAASEASAGELEGLLPKGLPAWVKARGSEAHNYFVFVEEVDKQQLGGGSTVYEALAKHVEKVPGLELSHLLGKGGFGSVYYGTWNGLPVAVKMIDNRLTKTNTEGVSLEALMGQELSHPNIVKTIKYVMRNALGASSMSGSNSRGTGSQARTVVAGLHHSRGPEYTSNNAGLNGAAGGNGFGSRHGSRGLLMPTLEHPGAAGAAACGSGGPSGAGMRGLPAGPAMTPYLTSAQPGLSGMTSAQMAAAADLTSASAMQHMVNTMGSDATTVMGGGSHFSGVTVPGGTDGAGGGSSGMTGGIGGSAVFAGGGVPPRAANLIGSSSATPVHGADSSADGHTTSNSGITAVGPASVHASSASTAAGPPSVASGHASGAPGGMPANVSSPPLSRHASQSFAPGAAAVATGRGSVGAQTPAVPVTTSASGTLRVAPLITSANAISPRRGAPTPPVITSAGPVSPRRGVPAPMPPAITSAGGIGSPHRGPLAHRSPAPPSLSPPSGGLRDPSAAAAVADEAAAQLAAADPGFASLTPEQQAAAMTSRFSLAFSTITSGGDVLVPGKGSPSSSSGPTQAMQQGSAGSGEDMGEVWIIMEFCDRGSLQDALDRGALKLRKPGGEVGETHLPMMVSTACEVASALQYLHDKGIVHGDLTAWNVMLCTAAQDRSGRTFVAKVADFGLSRTLDVKSKIKTRTYGTISHMPPECLISGIISKATDVFAFGVLLWQMYTGLRPWAGMNHGQIIYNVGMKNVQLLFPPGTPPAIADLSSSCTRTDPTQRPSFTEIMDKLSSIRNSLGL